MKIYIEDYNPSWPKEFEEVKKEIEQQLAFLSPVVEHIGSTSVPNLGAKPIIDILVGIHNAEDIDLSIRPLIQKNYIYYEKYNYVMPYRRFFVKLKSKPENLQVPSAYYESDLVPNELNEHKLANIHVLEYKSLHWIRHIAFRDYIKMHATIKEQYELLKRSLSKKEWIDVNDYNAAKDAFIKDIEAKAVKWYNNLN